MSSAARGSAWKGGWDLRVAPGRRGQRLRDLRMCLVEVTPGTEQGGASTKARTLGFAPGDGGRREAEGAQEKGRG